MGDLLDMLAHHKAAFLHERRRYRDGLRVANLELAQEALADAARHAAICTELRAMIAEDPTHD